MSLHYLFISIFSTFKKGRVKYLLKKRKKSLALPFLKVEKVEKVEVNLWLYLF
jgi:hypothetical protein